MRSVMRLSSAQSSSGTSAVMTSTVLMAADDGRASRRRACRRARRWRGSRAPRRSTARCAQAGVVDLLAHDGVGLAQRLQAIAGDGAEAANAQAGAGEGLALDHVLGQAELTADHAHLVLVQQLDGLAPARTADRRAGRPRCGAPSRRPGTPGCRGRWCPGRGS